MSITSKYKNLEFYKHESTRYGTEKKLTPTQCDEIRRTPPGTPRAVIAEKYGISKTYVTKLRCQESRAAERRARRKTKEPTDSELSAQFEKDYYGDM